MYNLTITILPAPVLENMFRKAFPGATAVEGEAFTYTLRADNQPNPADLAPFGGQVTAAQEIVTRDVKLNKVPVADAGAFAPAKAVKVGGATRGRKTNEEYARMTGFATVDEWKAAGSPKAAPAAVPAAV